MMSAFLIQSSRYLKIYNVSPYLTVLPAHLPCLNSPHMKLLSVKKAFMYSSSRNSSWTTFYVSLSQSGPVQSFQKLLIDFHDISGLPWWSVIMLTTLGIRSIVVFPLAVHLYQVIARLTNIKVELGKLAPELNKEVNVAKRLYSWDEKTAKKVFKKNMKDYYKKFILRDNCHPFKCVILALFQIPVWICFSVSLRNLTLLPTSFTGTGLVQPELKTEGALWFTDLTVPDKIFIPLLLMTVNLILTEIHRLHLLKEETKLQKFILYTTRFIILVIGAAATVNPSSVTFYWLCSSTFGLGQNLLLLVPRVRRLLNIPITANEHSHPFSNIAFNFRQRFMK